MKIISWNVNGLRAIAKKKEFWSFLDNVSPDILALQEIKSKENQLTMDVWKPHGYFSYFNSANRPGYSGTAVYSKKEPLKVSYGLGIEKFDSEGRIIEMEFEDFIFFNVYFPNGGQGEERLQFKLEFYEEFLKYLKIRSQENEGIKKGIIVTGDFNTAHTEIDLARPKENENISGFMPCERVWIDKYLENGFVDIYRKFYPDKKDAYSWWSLRTAARQRNIGWRIDYFLITENLVKNIQQVEILQNIIGSDHCPIMVEVAESNNKKD